MVGCFFSLNKRPQRVRGGMEPSTKQEMTVCFRCRVVCLSECLKWRQIHLKQGRLLHSGLSLCSSVRTVSSLLSSSDETFLGATCSPLVEFCCCSVTKVLQGSVKISLTPVISSICDKTLSTPLRYEEFCTEDSDIRRKHEWLQLCSRYR